jgi:hypothetical protein
MSKELNIVLITIVIATLIVLLSYRSINTVNEKKKIEEIEKFQLSNLRMTRHFVDITSEFNTHPKPSDGNILIINLVEEPNVTGMHFLGSYFDQDINKETVHFSINKGILTVVMKANVYPSYLVERRIKVMFNDIMLDKVNFL